MSTIVYTRRLAAALVATVALTLLTPSVFAQWDRLSGPIAPQVSEIVRHGDLLFLGTDFGDRGDVFVSADDGHTWTDSHRPNGGVSALYSHEGRLFVGGYLSGVYWSDDDGDTWTHAGPPLSHGTTEAIVALDSNIMIAGQDEFFPVPLYRSEDHGETWATINTGPSLRCFDVTYVDGVVLVGGDRAGIWRSVDGGLTWTTGNTGLPSQATTYRFATNGNTVYVAAWKISEAFLSVYRSDDLGVSWTQMNTAPITNAYIAAHLSYQDGALYMGVSGTSGTRGIFRSDDGGVNWSLLTGNLTGDGPNGKAALVVDGDLLVGTLDGAFRSADDGAIWSESWHGSSGVYTGNALVYAADRLHVGYHENAGVKRGLTSTPDLGNTWQSASLPSNNAQAVDYLAHNGAIYAALDGPTSSLLVSQDNGSSYVLNNAGIDPNTSFRCLAAHGDILFAGAWHTLFRSIDGGVSWTPDTSLGTVNAMVSHDGYIWAGLYPGGVVRSDDDGLTWTILDAGIESTRYINALAVHDGTVWASVNVQSVMRWDGEAWQDAGAAHSTDLVSTGDILLSSSYQGAVEYTTDGGATWHDFSHNLPGDHVEALCLTDTDIVLGARASGYWSRPLSDLPIATPVEGLPNATAWRLQVAPNPFNPQTAVNFNLPADGRITIDVYDAAGRKVRRLSDSIRTAGQHSVQWNGRDDAGRSMASGLYLIRAASSEHVATARAVLVR